jgi:hypothetical protein
LANFNSTHAAISAINARWLVSFAILDFAVPTIFLLAAISASINGNSKASPWITAATTLIGLMLFSFHYGLGWRPFSEVAGALLSVAFILSSSVRQASTIAGTGTVIYAVVQGEALWNARVCIRALQTPPSVKFEPRSLTAEFMHELAHLSTLNDGPRHAIEYLDKIGVSLVVEPQLPETYIDGAAILAGPDKPIVALTIRYDRLDNFWFVLMHELIHISRHLNADLTAFYDDLDVEDKTSIQEQEADDLAGEALNPAEEWKKSPASKLRTPDAVQHLASRLRIHPAIVAGRIRHQRKSYRVLNRLVGQGQVRRLFAQPVEA